MIKILKKIFKKMECLKNNSKKCFFPGEQVNNKIELIFYFLSALARVSRRVSFHSRHLHLLLVFIFDGSLKKKAAEATEKGKKETRQLKCTLAESIICWSLYWLQLHFATRCLTAVCFYFHFTQFTFTRDCKLSKPFLDF